MQNNKIMVRILSTVLLAGCLSHASEISFSLNDTYGRQVKSQDYEGVPIFLEFGACW